MSTPTKDDIARVICKHYCERQCRRCPGPCFGRFEEFEQYEMLARKILALIQPDDRTHALTSPTSSGAA